MTDININADQWRAIKNGERRQLITELRTPSIATGDIVNFIYNGVCIGYVEATSADHAALHLGADLLGNPRITGMRNNRPMQSREWKDLAVQEGYRTQEEFCDVLFAENNIINCQIVTWQFLQIEKTK